MVPIRMVRMRRVAIQEYVGGMIRGGRLRDAG